MPVQKISVSPMGGSVNNNSNTNTNGVNKQQNRNSGGNTVTGIPSMITCTNNGGGVGYDSQTSSLSSNSYDICRICHCEGDSEVPLIAPCYCAGSLRYVHQVCLQQWIKSSNIRSCELCKFLFIMQTKTKPFSEWEHLEMSGFERRKLICAVLFHAVALICVVWSLYVLIDRTAEEIQTGILEWPFWTKLIVVAIGFTGGVVFMYIQCKAYLQICQRWKAFNRVIYVQNAPEKPGLSPSHSINRLRSQSATAVHSSLPVVPAAGVSAADYRQTIEPSSSEFKPYQDGVRDNCSSDHDRDETSIDLKGVRNLHIFFNDENRIHVQKERSPSCKIDLDDNEIGNNCTDYNNITSNNGYNSNNSNSNNGQLCPTDNQGSMSWHIKIGKTATGTADSSNERLEARLGDLNQIQDEIARNTSATNNLESPVLKLQIKKAEIVIKFGQKGSGSSSNQSSNAVVGTSSTNSDALALINEDTSSFNVDEGNESSVNIKFDNCETDSSEPIFIDLVQSQSNAPATEHNDNPSTSSTSSSNPLQIRLDFGCKDIADASTRTGSNNSTEITMLNKNALKVLPSPSSSSQLLPTADNLSRPTSSRVTDGNDPGSKSEPGSGSQSPLLACRDSRHN